MDDRERKAAVAIFEHALPHCMSASLKAALAVIAAGGSEDDAIKAAGNASADAFEYWTINGEWPNEEENNG
jgi:hypothetical protein